MKQMDTLFFRTEPLKAWHGVINVEIIIYLMMFQFHCYLSLFHVLYFMYCLHLLHCTWVGCIRTCTKDLIHGILTNRWLVHNWFMGLGNLLEVIVVSLLDLNNESNTIFFLNWFFRVKVLTFRFGCSQTLNSNYWRWNWSCLTLYIMSCF